MFYARNCGRNYEVMIPGMGTTMNYLLHKKKHFTPFQLIILGFLLVIILGCLLLMLPCAAKDGTGVSAADALFTSVSATCVTGLVVRNTVTYWSVFGQAVILLLIQVGGMGVVTMAVSVAMVSGRKIGLMQRSTMQEAISAPNVGGIVRMTGFIIKTSFLMELLGAVAMLPVFYRVYGWSRGIWYAVFHSVSAFCNAGFDLLGHEVPFASLTSYQGDLVINLTVMLLIIIGGAGFFTWEDIRLHGFRLKKYKMQSKIIMLMTVVLILVPALFFYFLEFSQPEWDNMAGSDKIWNALFQAVTPRTAGFNTIDLTKFSEAGKAVMLILMLIGGAPGSTAGGMKVTTVAVLFLISFAAFKRREEVHCFGRRIPGDTVKYAAAILMLYLVLFLAGSIFISYTENLPMLDCLFETASAIGTVGLSLGLTPELCQISRVILIILMFFGRVGGLTLVFAAISPKGGGVSKLPQEKITVG